MNVVCDDKVINRKSFFQNQKREKFIRAQSAWNANKFVLLFIIFCIPFLHSRAQDSIAFDKIYDKISKEMASQKLSAALASADSLYRASHKPRFRIRSLMLVARLYQQQEDIDKSIEYAQRLEKLAAETGNYDWQAKGNGYLAGLYRMMGLYDQAGSYSEKALKVIPKIKDPERLNSTRGLILQELAFSNMDGVHNRQAIKYLEEAGQSLDKLRTNRDFMLLNNERLLGDNYRLLKSYDTALVYYKKALALGSQFPRHYTVGMTYKGMTEILIELGDLKAAKTCLDEANKIADESEYLQLKEGIYAISKRYYEKVKDNDQLAVARAKKDSVTGVLLDKRSELLDKTYHQLEQRGVEAERSGNIKTVAIFGVILLLVSGAGFFIIYHKKKKQQLAQFKYILDHLHKKEAPRTITKPSAVAEQSSAMYIPPVPEAVEPQSVPDAREKRIMTEETELKLLKGLDEFEKSDLFLDSELSLSSLATRLNTNTRYLSQVIKDHRKTDFNSYINELRVNYIVDKLKNDPGWKDYKISALASIAGFSSHSQFAAVFKTFVGLSPSVFIKYLDKRQD